VIGCATADAEAVASFGMLNRARRSVPQPSQPGTSVESSSSGGTLPEGCSRKLRRQIPHKLSSAILDTTTNRRAPV
jgi:hypothetical protein